MTKKYLVNYLDENNRSVTEQVSAIEFDELMERDQNCEICMVSAISLEGLKVLEENDDAN